ncbi:MAG: ABC transporter ATP-binding protein [Aliidiomarina sp.]|uniref:ABC transporter ATP-binding protein n=1 Tax=Aliidiomarina sp. TaxID=1872439 RepID=UPI0025BD7951|nr:ABC transporter ATP-binding protein [Aliidiomarina sp.]MCH8501452.1 ABC transporter ATP-binding protein [Aliidiomarina sp.]
MALKLEQVSFAYRADEPVLRDISSLIHAGKLTAIIGENGSGKSTLMNLIAGISKPTAGRIVRPSSDFASIGYLGQNEQPSWALSATDLVAIGLLSQRNVDQNQAHQRVTQVLEQVDCAHLAQRSIAQISAGELQRLQLARALVAEQAVILADEPTAALDLRHQGSIMRLLREQADNGKVVVVVLHDLQLVQTWCDDVVVLKAGRVHQQGRVDEILNADLVRQVFGVSDF